MYSFSASAIKLFNECREKYRLRYIEGIEDRAPAIHLTFGRAMHKVPEAYWAGKSAEKAYQWALEVTQEIDPYQLSSKVRTRWIGMLDSLSACIQTYYAAEEHHRGLHPLGVEESFEVIINHKRWCVNGRIDQYLVSRNADTERVILRDLKTASEVGDNWRREYRESLLRNTGIMVYDWSRCLSGKPPDEIGFEVLIKPYRGSEPRYEYFDVTQEIVAYRERTAHLIEMTCNEMADYHDRYAKVSPWPMSESACTSKFGVCEYLPYCNHGITEKTGQLYKIRERHK